MRIVSQLDPNLDPRTFRLGDLKLGNIAVHVPGGVGSFQQDIDLTKSKGFILRVSGGIDINSDTMTWLLQAIDPMTGEVITDPSKGLLPPDNAQGAGEGFVSYTVEPKAGLATGTLINSQARVLFNTTAPLDTPQITYTIDGHAFATGIGQSQPSIGPVALLTLANGSVLVSGGAARNQLFEFGAAGGQAGTPVATFAEPIYDMALDAAGNIWAATGGGPLYELDPKNFAVLGQFGDSLTQSLAIQPGTGLIYVSSGKGIEVFDPVKDTFHHFSDIRVGSLAFDNQGTLWAATWPHNQTQVIQFTGTPLAPKLMLQFASDVDSIAFGQPGSKDAKGNLIDSGIGLGGIFVFNAQAIVNAVDDPMKNKYVDDSTGQLVDQPIPGVTYPLLSRLGIDDLKVTGSSLFPKASWPPLSAPAG